MKYVILSLSLSFYFQHYKDNICMKQLEASHCYKSGNGTRRLQKEIQRDSKQQNTYQFSPDSSYQEIEAQRKGKRRTGMTSSLFLFLFISQPSHRTLPVNCEPLWSRPTDYIEYKHIGTGETSACRLTVIRASLFLFL